MRALPLSLLALTLAAAALPARAASLALVPTGASATSHQYDVVLDSGGEPLGSFDLFVEAVQTSGVGLLSTSAEDFVAAAGGAVLGPDFETAFFPLFNGAHWGGFNDGPDLPFVDATVIGTFSVHHVALGPGDEIELRLAASPPSGLSNAAGALPLEVATPLATIPEPASTLLLALALGPLALRPLRRR